MSTILPEKSRRHRVDGTIAFLTLCIIALLAVFPIHNNDIWWHMAVGKLILETRAFISTDPFSFTVGGHPWMPQSYLAGSIIYFVSAAGSAPALIVLRVLLVLGSFLVMMWILARREFGLALASPVLLLAALSLYAHRFRIEFAEAEREASRAHDIDPHNRDAREIIRKLGHAREGS